VWWFPSTAVEVSTSSPRDGQGTLVNLTVAMLKQLFITVAMLKRLFITVAMLKRLFITVAMLKQWFIAMEG